MAINLGLLSTGANAALSLSNLIMATPTNINPGTTKGYQPLNPVNADGTPSIAALPPTLLFHYEGEQSVTVESDITDHFVESNYSIQDQIALKPETFTTRGFIGELNDVVPPELASLQTIAETLTTINSYTPQLSVTALLAYNKALLQYEVASNVANSAISAWSSVSSLFSSSNSGNEVFAGTGVFQSGSNIVQNKQQSMFQQLYAYWAQRTLFNVQTPWAIFSNMAIKSLRSIQDAETRMITDFEITFKKIRTASTLTIAGGLNALKSGRNAAQSSAVNNIGSQAGKPGFSLASSIRSLV